MVKRIFSYILFLLLLAGISQPVQAFQNTQSGDEETPAEQADDRIQLSQLGLEHVQILQGPYDHAELDFNFPAGWIPTKDARLQLEIVRSISSLMGAQDEPSMEGVLSGILAVTLNDTLLDSFVLQGSGSQTLSFTIPDGLLAPGAREDSQRLSIAWDAGASCDFNLASSVSILPSSFFVIPHDSAALKTDLTAYPAPLYRENAPDNAATHIVVKDDASEAELSAALSAAAGLGRMSQANMELDLLAYSSLSDETGMKDHLIFIGRQKDFPMLLDYAAAGSADIDDSNGIIWETLSPGDENIIIVAGGASDAATLAAGRALSRGSLFSAGTENNLVLVDSTAAETVPADFPQDRTLAMLQQEDLTFNEAGTSRVVIPFEIPAGVQVSAEAYFDLVINHSQLIDYLQSGVVVSLNDRAIGSVRLSDSTSTLNTTRLIIPVSTLRNGTNRLEIQVDIGPRSICSDPRQGSLWVTVFSDSVLHLPVSEQVFAAAAVQSIAEYPRPLSDNARLSDLVFILPPDDTSAWQAAAQLAFYLGYRSAGKASEARVVFSNSLEIESLENVNMLVVGQPASLPAVVNRLLPVPFEGNEISASARSALPFRVPQDAGIGYIEMAQFGSQGTHIMLAVLGSTEEGLDAAVDALLDEGQRRRMAGGNFAAVQGSRLAVENVSNRAQSETGAGPQQEALPESVQPEAEAAGEAAAEMLPGQQRYAWIMPVLVLSIALIFIVIGLQIRSAVKKRK